MTVASLFIKLGFKIENKESFDKAVSQLGFGEAKAVNLKHALAGLNAAMIGLMYYATNSATGLYKFHVATGLSTKSLQDWQFAGAKANVAAGEVTSAIKGIQDAQSDLLLGTGNIAPWTLLGISSRTDPFQVLWQIHERVKQTGGLAPGLGRAITSQLGISEEMFQFLRRDDIALGELQEKFKQTTDDQKNLDELNGKFNQMKYEVEQLAVKLGAQLGPAFADLLKNAVPWIEKAANWLAKLASNTPEGERMRAEFTALAKGVFYAATAFTALSVALKGVATVAAASTVIRTLLGLGGAAAAAGGGAAAAGTTAAAAGGGAAAAATGGVGVGTATAAGLAGSLALGLILPFVAMMSSIAAHTPSKEGGDNSVWGRFKRGAGVPEGEGIFDHFGGDEREAWHPPSWMTKMNDAANAAFDGPKNGGAGSNVSVTVTQHISGAGDPEAVGMASAAAINKVIKTTNAAFMDQGAAAAGAY